jgi:hypothetical protein
LFVPLNTAASSVTPTASARPCCTSGQKSMPEASSTTASGTGTMAAISSASSVMPAHAISVVCFSPVSPLTK